MGIFGALTTAVAGLQAQSFALENISGNIANSQTVGFKRTETSFKDLLMGGSFNPATQISGSVSAYSRSTNDLQGALLNTESNTSIAVSGSGFFTVASPTGQADGLPVFGGGELYTRRGDFEFDKDGFLVNGAGYFLKGQRLDVDSGNPVGAAQPIRVDKDFFPAARTTNIRYEANLPSDPPNGLMPAAGSPGAIGATVSATQTPAFLAETIEGDQVTVYDAKGDSSDLQIRWGKVSEGPDTWAAFYQSNSAAVGAAVQWTRVTPDYVFNANGTLQTPANGQVTFAPLTIDGKNLGNVTMAHGAGLTQFGDPSGTTTTNEISQDGAAAGEMVAVEISDGGLVTASYSNGKSRALYKVPLVDFNAPNQLAHLDGGAFAATASSGVAFESTNGAIAGQSIEQSNVDVADEFTKLIVTQQAYSANTRVVSTSNDMMQETLNMIR